MPLLNKLQSQGSNLSTFNGSTPPVTVSIDSKLHYSYSLNGIPDNVSLRQPSNLDLNGQVPSYNYRDNSPEGASF